MLKKTFSILLIVALLVISCKKDPSATPPPVIKPPTPPLVLNVSVYPNPTTGIFTIQTNDTRPDSLQIVNALGQVVLNQIISSTTVIDIIGIQSGIYYVTVTPTIGNKVIRKIIVIH